MNPTQHTFKADCSRRKIRWGAK